MNKVEQLNEWINQSKHTVFFGGAGVSTESGIPDFRSVDGLYNQKYDYPPEVILSHSFFSANPKKFYEFYRDKMIFKNAKPNKAHTVLAEMEKKGKLKAVITQNIDGLHRAAGSNIVLELHGSVYRNYCIKCGKSYDIDVIENSDSVPYCSCGGIIKPDVVLYEEQLDSYILDMSIAYIQAAELLIVGGTSLTVQPAASLLYNYMGNKLVLINKSPTPMDSKADLLITEPIGEVFGKLKI